MWTVAELLEGSGGVLQGNLPTDVEFSGFSIDSRSVRPNDFFIALNGPRFDGHDYVERVVQKKGIGAIVSRARYLENKEHWRRFIDTFHFIVVEDTLAALQALAAWHRSRFSLPLIGITGSNGKTTTKEMTASILQQQGAVLKSEGNLNNHIGLPLSLLRLHKQHQWAVLEMGINQRGEMTRLCHMAKPTTALITNIGQAHLEGLGDLEGVGKEKGLLFESLDDSGTAVINHDDPILKRWETRLPHCWTFGFDFKADITAAHVVDEVDGVRFKLRRNRLGDESEIKLMAPGRHQVMNALAASAVASSQGICINKITEGLVRFHPLAKRTEILKLKGITILFDVYNANPDSMKAALKWLVSYPKGRGSRVALLGEMLELGSFTESAHFELGRTLACIGIDRLIAVGASAEIVAAGARQEGMAHEAMTCRRDMDVLRKTFGTLLKQNDVVLVKGSRMMRMERVLEALPDVL